MFKIVGRIFLSLVLFISTTGLTISKHYCGNNLISFSLFGNAKSCTGMDDSCCHQESDTYRLSADYTQPVYNLTFDQDRDVMPPQTTVYNTALRAGFLCPDRSGLGPPHSNTLNQPSLQTFRL